MKLAYVFLFMTFSLNTFAKFDSQCNKIKPNQAKRALKILQNAQKKSDFFIVDRYCEFCEETKYPKPILVETVSIDSDESTAKIKINNKEQDLAYIYVEGENLAHKVGCRTIAVSQYLD